MDSIDKRQAKHDLILTKGLDVLWSNGYNGTSINDIVKAADVPKGSFYYYFDSKDDFAEKALEFYYRQKCKPEIEKLRNVGDRPLETLLKFYSDRNDLMKNELQYERGSLIDNLSSEVSDHNERLRSKIMELNNRVVKLIKKTMTLAMENGDIDADQDVEELVQFTEDVFAGALMRMKEQKNGRSLDIALKMVEKILRK